MNEGDCVLIVVNVDWYFVAHRLWLVQELRRAGARVVVAAGIEAGHDDRIRASGAEFVELPLRRSALNPFSELRTLWCLVRLDRSLRPTTVLHITIKPVLYGSIAARLVGVARVVNLFPGLGFMFSGRGIAGRARSAVALLAYRMAIPRRAWAIFENRDDGELLRSWGIVAANRSMVVPGAGVDLAAIAPAGLPAGTPLVVLATRMLWDKGVDVFVEAVRELRRRGVDFRAALVGRPDRENPNHVPDSQLLAWRDEGIVEYWGHREDMVDVLAQASIVALPTCYREGIPRVLLEAGAVGRPVVATDVPGCRDYVRPNRNGLLVPPRDARALADALECLLSDAGLRERMGTEARRIVAAEYSVAHVSALMMSLLDGR